MQIKFEALGHRKIWLSCQKPLDSFTWFFFNQAVCILNITNLVIIFYEIIYMK